MPFLSPPSHALVGKITMLYGWQRDWLGINRWLNYSGLTRTFVAQIIQAKEPSYFEKYKEIYESKQVKRQENIERLLPQIKSLVI